MKSKLLAEHEYAGTKAKVNSGTRIGWLTVSTGLKAKHLRLIQQSENYAEYRQQYLNRSSWAKLKMFFS